MFEKIITRSFFAATFAAVALVLVHGLEVLPRAGESTVAVVKLPTVVIAGRAVAPRQVAQDERAEAARRGPG